MDAPQRARRMFSSFLCESHRYHVLLLLTHPSIFKSYFKNGSATYSQTQMVDMKPQPRFQPGPSSGDSRVLSSSSAPFKSTACPCDITHCWQNEALFCHSAGRRHLQARAWILLHWAPYPLPFAHFNLYLFSLSALFRYS